MTKYIVISKKDWQLNNNLNRKILVYMFVIFSFVFILIISIYFLLQILLIQEPIEEKTTQQWRVRSIDTMKYSRDPSREKLNDKSFDTFIDKQMSDIAAANANFVAIGTPYDEEFLPLLKRWVKSARKHKLHVWFRGNFSGWEGWFGYERIDRQTHTAKTQKFILDNPELFQDGDIFTSCPECENGIKVEWGDPASLEVHKKFLIEEYNVSQKAFAAINKNVGAGYYSMNGDLARAMMDKETTAALGGVVVIDHYVDTPERLVNDIRDYANRSGGQVMLGEFGAPIPDIHGDMTEEEQNQWISLALSEMSKIPELIGVNYWVNIGGSTAIWNDNATERKAVKTIKNFYIFLGGGQK
jgi:hypothetical protein